MLSKEVLPPQKPQNGVGVMVVAAAAMFFAVASSALILRSRMASECCPAHAAQAPPPVVEVGIPIATPADTHCGEPVYQKLADGTLSITYKACPDVDVQTVDRQPHYITVDRIEAPATPTTSGAQ